MHVTSKVTSKYVNMKVYLEIKKTIVVSPYKPHRTSDPLGGVTFDPGAMICTTLVHDKKKMLHTKF